MFAEFVVPALLLIGDRILMELRNRGKSRAIGYSDSYG